jgi:hypothetical protein
MSRMNRINTYIDRLSASWRGRYRWKRSKTTAPLLFPYRHRIDLEYFEENRPFAGLHTYRRDYMDHASASRNSIWILYFRSIRYQKFTHRARSKQRTRRSSGLGFLTRHTRSALLDGISRVSLKPDPSMTFYSWTFFYIYYNF